jgi:hypothetical protein
VCVSQTEIQFTQEKNKTNKRTSKTSKQKPNSQQITPTRSGGRVANAARSERSSLAYSLDSNQGNSQTTKQPNNQTNQPTKKQNQRNSKLTQHNTKKHTNSHPLERQGGKRCQTGQIALGVFTGLKPSEQTNTTKRKTQKQPNNQTIATCHLPPCLRDEFAEIRASARKQANTAERNIQATTPTRSGGRAAKAARPERSPLAYSQD